MEQSPYLTELFYRFGGYEGTDTEFECICHDLREQLTKDQRKILLRLIDREIEFGEQAAFDSFARGFKLAAELAAELTGVCLIKRE